MDENQYVLEEHRGNMVLRRQRNQDAELREENRLLQEENFQMRNMLHRLEILLRNHNRNRSILATAMDDIRRTRSLTEQLEIQMHTIYRQPLVLLTELESIYEALEIFGATHVLLIQQNHLSTGNHNIEFTYG